MNNRLITEKFFGLVFCFLAIILVSTSCLQAGHNNLPVATQILSTPVDTKVISTPITNSATSTLATSAPIIYDACWKKELAVPPYINGSLLFFDFNGNETFVWDLNSFMIKHLKHLNNVGTSVSLDGTFVAG